MWVERVRRRRKQPKCRYMMLRKSTSLKVSHVLFFWGPLCLKSIFIWQVTQETHLHPQALKAYTGNTFHVCNACNCWHGNAFLCIYISCFVQGGKLFQWEFVHGLLESAIYGGRIDNPSDLRILRSYLEQFFSARLLSSSAGQKRSRGGARIFPPQISLPNSCSILVRCQHDTTTRTQAQNFDAVPSKWEISIQTNLVLPKAILSYRDLIRM